MLRQIATTRGTCHSLTPRQKSSSPVPTPPKVQRETVPQKSSSPLPAWQRAETSRPGFPQFERPSRVFVLAQFLTFASAAEPPSFPRSLVRREQPQVDVNGHPPRSKSARSDSSRMGEQGTHLLLLRNRLNTHGMKNAKRWRVPDRISRAPALLPHLKRRDTSATEILEPSP
jgi:hypothetical protein